MIDRILQAAGFVKGVTYAETVFRRPPSRTYVVYFDSVETDGADFTVDIDYHSVRLELYALDKPDAATEKRLESALKAEGIHYSKSDREWIVSEKYFLTTYEFEFTEKE